jgi:lia operon protein LiaG
MSTALLRSALLGVAGALLTASPLAAQERHVLTGPRAVIWNLAGEVRLEPGTGSDIVVEITRGGADGKQLEITASGGELKIRYPDDDVVYRGDRGSRGSTSLNVSSDGRFNGDWGNGGRRTRVKSSGSGLEAHADLVVRVPAGKRVEVNLAVGMVEANNVVAELRLDVHAASVSATGTKGSLVVDAGSGSVRVENASGDLDVDTGSGSTTLSGLRMTRIAVDAGSGSVNARDVTADRFSVDVGSGTVTAEGLTTDDLYIDTGSGGVRLELLKVPGRSDLDTGSGTVTIALPANANADLDIETGSGGISTDFAVTMDRFQRRALRGRIGEGGPVIRVSAGSGGVRLRKLP